MRNKVEIGILSPELEHDIKEIKFIGDALEATIDGVAKRFSLKDVSPLLEKATEIEKKLSRFRHQGMGYIGHC